MQLVVTTATMFLALGAAGGIAGRADGVAVTPSALQTPAATPSTDSALRRYAGVYQWAPDAFVYLQLWNEFTGTNQLTAFDESGEVRTLYPDGKDRFIAGPGAAVPTPVESRIEFQRNAAGAITALTWTRTADAPRTARRVDAERAEDVQFASGAIRLAGTLIRPRTGGLHPAVILVHGSGPQTRESILPFARFLVRHGMAVLGYDKRGVGGSTGEWNTASFDDLASDVVAAFEYLKTRKDIDARHIGVLGVSQAGWIMPLAAVRAKELAFLISVSGAGVPAEETTMDQARNELTARGLKPETVAQITRLMSLQNRFARTGEGWDEYTTAREALAAKIGPPPDTFPATREHPYWQVIRRLYFYDPAPTLRRLQVPTLALFGELDNNILPEKNQRAWERALQAGGNRDYQVHVLPKANHIQLEAVRGNNAEMPSLRRFVPDYFATVRAWLAERIPGFGTPPRRLP